MQTKPSQTPSAQSASKGLRRLNAGMFAFFALIVGSATLVYLSAAATITSRKDTMSNQGISLTSTHNISFNFSGANTFASGESIVIDFPETSAFTTSGIWLTTDFAFSDGVARTIDAVAYGPGISTVSCTNLANTVGVAIDTASLIFRVIPCGALFSPSGAGAAATFTISGESPNGTLTNPSAIGSYSINILNAGGDCTGVGENCRIGVVVVDSSAVSVSATVSSVCSNGVVESGESCDDSNLINGDGCSATCQTEGGGGGPPPDTTAPVISNIQCTNIGISTATVSWVTNEAADTLVNYGLTNAYGSNSSDLNFVVNHSRSLSGLTEGATYHYQVCSKDSVNNNSCSTDQTCTTLDSTPPVITSALCTPDPAGTSATMTWTTNEPATRWVEYGLVAGPPYANTVGTATPLQTSHSVSLTGLNAGSTYHYRLRSGDASANESLTTNATCVMPTPAPLCNVCSRLSYDLYIINPDLSERHTGTPWVWTTDLGSGKFRYSFEDSTLDTNSPSYDHNDSVIELNTSACGAIVVDYISSDAAWIHKIRIKTFIDGVEKSDTLLANNDDLVVATQAFFNAPASFDLTASCAVDPLTLVAQPVISNILVTNLTSTSARITWDTNVIATSILDYGTTNAYGQTSTTPVMVTAHQLDLTGLTPNQLYNYRITSKDPSNNTKVSTNLTFTTPLPPAPVISAVSVTNITQTSARVVWTTSTNTDTKLESGLTNAYGTTATNPALVTSHLVNLTALTKGTTYHYKITSVDAFAQSATTLNATFSTLADVTAPANVSGLSAVAGDSQVTLAWTNPGDADFQGVRVVRKTSGFPTGPLDGTLVYSGPLETKVDTGRTNGVIYYYAVYSFDDVPNYSSGSVNSATPIGTADIIAPGLVTGFTATPGNTQNILAWTNPTDIDLAGVKILRKTGSYSANNTDGTVVYDGLGTSVANTGLTNGTLYFYSAYAYDSVLNYSASAQAQATPTAPIIPPDTTGPGPVTNLIAVAGDNQVQLTWTNPSDIDWSGTRILRKTGSNPTSASDGTIVYEGVGDVRLDPFALNGTTYYYGAYTFDGSSNFSTGVFVSATPTAGLPPPPAPACSDSDGGQTYDVRGSVSTSSQIYEDTCFDSTTVSENYCSGPNQVVEQHQCDSGFRCSAGACVLNSIVPTTEICGNGQCAENENNLTCPSDCPVTPVLPPFVPVTPQAEYHMTLADMRFSATSARMPLRVQNETLTVYVGMTFTMKIPDESIKKPITSAYVNLLANAYAMRQTASFEAVVAAPLNQATTTFTVIVNYEDGTSDSIEGKIKTVPKSQVYEVVNGNEVGIPGARATLLVDNGGGNFGLWDGSASGQTNPSTTDGNGIFGFIVPTGVYKLRIDAENFGTSDTLAFSVGDDNVVQRRVKMIRLPKPTVAGVATFVADTAVETVKDIISNEFIEENSEAIAAPVAIAVAVANVATASAVTATAAPFLLNLWSFLAHPFLLLARRRRKQWGIVYNALTKLPVDLAIVRLLDSKTGRPLRSAVTDKEGRYFFIVTPGEYKIAVTKVGFVFPTTYMKGSKEDGKFLDIYHGEIVTVKDETSLTANIPLDPVVAEKTSRRIQLEGVGRMLQKGISVVAILGMIGVFIISPSLIMGGILVANIIFYFVFRRLAVPKQPKNWGIVYDEKTGKPLSNVVARVFETKYNKLLETQVTDLRGRYAFLVGTNVYYVTFEKPGYTKAKEGPIDVPAIAVTAKGKPSSQSQIVAVDIRLSPGTPPVIASKAKQSQPPTPPPVIPPSPPTPPPPVIPANAGIHTPPSTPPTTPTPVIPANLSPEALAKGDAGIHTPPPSTPPASTPKPITDPSHLLEDSAHAHPPEPPTTPEAPHPKEKW